MPASTTRTPHAAPSALDRFFHISERGSSVGQEVRGGLVTFFAMAYILVVNASILSVAAPEGVSPTAIAAGTALVGGLMTILMGLVANFPMGLAAGMGLNAIVAFTLANPEAMGLTYAEAMGLIFWEGVAITVLVLTGFRAAVFKAVPAQLKTAISVGIGLFICFVGLINAGIIRPGGTYVQLGINGSLAGWPSLVFVVGLIIVIILHVRRVQGAILIAIAASTVLAAIIQAFAGLGIQGSDEGGNPVNVTGWATNAPALEGSPIQLPDFSTLGHIDIFGAFSKLGPVAVVLIVFSLMLADFFDTMGTMVAVGQGARLLDESGNPPRTREVLLIDSLAAVAGGLGGVSSNTSYVESTSGVAEGARTGLASLVTGGMFLLSIFIAPLVELVPAESASISLVFVGFLMMMNVADIDWVNPRYAVPCFLTIAMMPFAYSITAGIGFGFIAYVIVTLAAGKAREIKPLMWIVSLLFVVYFCLGPIEGLLT
ncbi:MAG: NCS2 family permease [Actinomycetaceae bacterium]|nr:NCS2 family permease [Actinomycetaceae bacterium]